MNEFKTEKSKVFIFPKKHPLSTQDVLFFMQRKIQQPGAQIIQRTRSWERADKELACVLSGKMMPVPFMYIIPLDP